MKLHEIFESKEMLFLEAKDKKLYLGTLRIPLALADVKNGNGRIYSSALLKREMHRMDEKASKGMVAGMLDHDVGGLTKLDKISHAFTSFEFDEKEKIAYGTAKILNTSKGRDLEILLDAVPVGASTVGRGTIGVGGNVLDDYQMKSADLVSNPSSGIHISGKNLMESLNTLVERHENGEVVDDPQVSVALIMERQHAGYYKLEKEKKTIKAVKNDLTEEERRIAGGPRITE